MVNYVCVKKSQIPPIASNKSSKIKIFRGSMPPGPPSLQHVLHTDTYLPPNNPYDIILASLGQKPERNHAST